MVICTYVPTHSLPARSTSCSLTWNRGLCLGEELLFPPVDDFVWCTKWDLLYLGLGGEPVGDCTLTSGGELVELTRVVVVLSGRPETELAVDTPSSPRVVMWMVTMRWDLLECSWTCVLWVARRFIPSLTTESSSLSLGTSLLKEKVFKEQVIRDACQYNLSVILVTSTSPLRLSNTSWWETSCAISNFAEYHPNN